MRIILAAWEWATDPSGSYWQPPGGHADVVMDLRTLPQAGTRVTPLGVGIFGYATLPRGLVPIADLGDDPLARMALARRNALADTLGIPRAALSDASLAMILGEQVLGSLGDPAGVSAKKPLRMTRKGADLTLGGFGRVWSTRLDKAHPVYAQTLAIRQIDYRRERAAVLAEGQRRGLTQAESLAPLQRWTGWDMRALGITDDSLLLPPEFASDGNRKPSTILTETWPTDGASIATGQDQPWTMTMGDLDVSAGVLVAVTTGGFSIAICDTALSSDDHEHTAPGTTATPTSGGNSANVLVRYDGLVTAGEPRNAYLVQTLRLASAGADRLRKMVAGVGTNLASFTNTSTAETLLVTADGSSISGSAGAALGPVTDTDVTGFTKVGVMIGRSAASGSSADITLDTHTFQDIGQVAVVTPAVAAAVMAGIDPAAVPGAVQVAPAVASAPVTALDPTAVPGAATALPGVAFALLGALDGTPVPGSVSLSPTVAAAILTALDATLGTGTTVTASVASAVMGALDATSTPGAATKSPGVASAVLAALDPTPVPGSVTLAAGVAQATLLGLDPTVAATIALSPAAAVATMLALGPTAVPGFASVSPGVAFAILTALDASIFHAFIVPAHHMLEPAPRSWIVDASERAHIIEPPLRRWVD